MPLPGTRETRWLVGIVAAGSLLLWVTAIPEVFTLDECNYLATVRALRDGGLFVPGTEGLSASPELSGFDPTNSGRAAHVTPVAPTVPPLYAPLALPFAAFGWRGLILLNALAFALTSALVFVLARRHAKRRHTPWLALALYGLGGFAWDYAQGMWPHMVSVALTTGAVWLALRAREEDRLGLGLAAGALVGVAAGIRYQNIVFAAAVGLTVLIGSKRRLAAGAAFAAGVAGPVAVTSLINHARLGTYNPISKGSGYLAAGPVDGPSTAAALADRLTTLWARVVDYSAHPPFTSPHGRATLPKDPDTGVFLVVGGLKKALLQSAPWIAIALVAFALVWSARGSARLGTGEQRALMKSLAVPAFAVLALFTWAGLARHDGWSFNQRYLLELVPLFAVAVALVADGWELDPQPLVIGGAIGAALAAVPVVAVIPEHWFRQRALMLVPLVAAACLLGAWLSASPRLRWGLLATCLGWSLVVHVGDDMQAARGLRDFNGFQRRAVGGHLPDGASALIAIAPQKEAMCPLGLERDLLMIDPSADDARSTGALTDELLAKGRRVFVVGGMPDHYLAAVFSGRRLHMIATQPMPFAEVRAASPAAPE